MTRSKALYAYSFFGACFSAAMSLDRLRLAGRSVRAADGARLESVYTLITYRGFESHLLRIFLAYRT